MNNEQINFFGLIIIPIILFVAKIIYDMFKRKDEKTSSYKNNVIVKDNSSSFNNNGNIIANDGSSINIDNSNHYHTVTNELNGQKNKDNIVSSVRKRLSYAIDRINLHKNDNEKITYGRIIDELGYQSLEDLEKLINSADNDFIDKVSALLGINRDWLRDGIKEVFFIENQQRKEERSFIWSDKYSFKEYYDSYKIIINKDCLIPPCDQYNAIIVQKRDRYKNFVIFDSNNSPFEFLNPCIGKLNYSGCRSALRFYKLIDMLKQKQWEDVSNDKSRWVTASSYQDRTYFVSNEQFENIIKGKDYIDNILHDVKEIEHSLAYALFYKDDTYGINPMYYKWLHELKTMIMRMDPTMFV